MTRQAKIGILTGGGDAPGLNAVIRAVTKKAILDCGMEVIGIEDGYEGLMQNRSRPLHYEDVSGIISLGGTILGTSNTANPYHQAVTRNGRLEFEDMSRQTIANIKALELDCLVCIGGDGTLKTANRLFNDGIPVVGLPKTIDNDLRGTDVCFGFDTAVAIATEGIDRLHSTAQSHHRVMVVELMGRTAGWIALHAGIAGGGDILLIPEIPYDIDVVVSKVQERSRKGKRFSIIVVAEGAKPKNGDVVISRIVKDSPDPVRLGGISFVLAAEIEKRSNIESRAVVMGHLQRGGTPTAFDRILATRLGAEAVEMISKGNFGKMVGVRGQSLVATPLEEVAIGPRHVQTDDPLVNTARSVGTCMGDY